MGKTPQESFLYKIGLVLFIAPLLFFSIAEADPDTQFATVYTVGSSMRSTNVSAGRNEAIEDSLVVAVTQVLNDLISPEVMEGHFQVLSQFVFPKTDQFIADYKMLTESSHGKTQWVMVKATVSTQRLKDALKELGIYAGRKQLPRVLFCIAVKQVNDIGYRYWWLGQPTWRAGAVTETFERVAQDQGFSVVTPEVDASISNYSPELNVSEAVALGQQMQADVVVVGQAVAEELPHQAGAGFRSFQGTITAQAYSVRNGQPIAKVEKNATQNGGDPGAVGEQLLSTIAQTTAEDLVNQMIQSWQSADIGRSQIELVIEGISGHIAEFVKLRGALSTLSGVDDVQRKEMQSDRGVLLVDFQGSARALADILSQQHFDTFTLDISEPEKNTIQLQILSP